VKKEYVVKQFDLRDCGACSLLSIIKYYGGYVPLEKIRIDTNTTIDGTTAYNIISAAKKYGFSASGIKLEKEDLFKQSVPFIAHTLQNGIEHFVVVFQINSKHLTIMDPARGYIKYTEENFLEIWTNIILVFNPNTQIINLEKPESIFGLFIQIFLEEKTIFLKLIYTSIVLTLVTIITSYYFKLAISNISERSNLYYVILLIGIFTIFKIVLTYLRSYFENFLNKNIDIKIAYPFLYRLFHLPSNTIISRSTGEIMTRFGELNQIKDLFSKVFLTILLDLLLAFCAIILLININEILFSFLVVVAFLYAIIGIIYSPIIYKMVLENIDCETSYSTLLVESLNANQSIKNLNCIDKAVSQLEQQQVALYKNNYSLNKVVNNQSLLKNFINEIGLFVINSFGFVLILNQKIELVDLIMFNTLLVYLIDPIKNIIDLIPTINYIRASFNKISEFNNLELESDKGSNTFINGDIEFKHISYSYNNYNYVLDDFNLKIKAGKHVLFKGSSGSGKSTVCKLISRLFESQKGNIYIGANSIKEYKLGTIRENITYLSQKEYLFTNTIRNNILMGDECDENRFQSILEMCELNSFLKSKPLGLETLLYENGKNISGGERQRIILARALMKESQILILDEALSEIEESLEKRIIKNIRSCFKDKTIIYISHRECNLKFDEIVDFGVHI